MYHWKGVWINNFIRGAQLLWKLLRVRDVVYRNQYIFGLPVEICGSRRRIQGSSRPPLIKALYCKMSKVKSNRKVNNSHSYFPLEIWVNLTFSSCRLKKVTLVLKWNIWLDSYHCSGETLFWLLFYLYFFQVKPQFQMMVPPLWNCWTSFTLLQRPWWTSPNLRMLR